MAKINLPNIGSGFGTTTLLNDAFSSIETEFQDKVLYRDNPTGEPNQMEQDLDMNDNSINNVDEITATTVTAQTIVIDGISIGEQVGLAEASAQASAASAQASANSAAATAAVYDQFDDRYLGAKANEPVVDNDGSALLTGALYFNTVEDILYLFTGTSWLPIPVLEQSQLNVFKYTATAGQTTFTGLDDAGNTLAYAQNRLIVTLNGVVLELGSEYTAANNSSVVLLSGAALGDELNVYAFTAMNLGNYQPRIISVSTTSSLTVNAFTTDQYNITALASALTINNPSGVPYDGQKLILRITSSTVNALTWGTSFYPLGAALPTATYANKTLYLGFVYNTLSSKWDLLGVVQEG